MSGYATIKEWYGDKKAKRSQLPLMNHIEEGISILRYLGANEDTVQAFCIHPMIQSDADLAANYKKMSCIRSIWILLAMEYRDVANEYLSMRNIEHVSEIRLSTLPEVNQMLIADKIQNYKDFSIYHKDSHPKSKVLEKYFQNWFDRLELKPSKVKEMVEYIGYAE